MILSPFRATTMDELIPILAGVLLGLAFASGLPWRRFRAVRAGLIVAVGVASTWASDEYLETWLVRRLRGVPAPTTLGR
jgi:hypothetical protein